MLSNLHMKYGEAVLQTYQSDRTYPPYFARLNSKESWFNISLNCTATNSEFIYPGMGPIHNPNTVFTGPDFAFTIKDSNFIQVPIRSDILNCWTVLLDWSKDVHIELGKEEIFRDYKRTVLQRNSTFGKEKLFIDNKTGYPVKLDYYEPHSLWGQVHVEIIYSNWKNVSNSNASMPTTAFRMDDGNTTIYRTIGESELIDSSPSLFNFPKDYIKQSSSLIGNTGNYLSPQPQLEKISNSTYLLKGKTYNEVFTKVHDTIYIFDVTLSEVRAKQDSSLISNIFPGKHPVSVVVTDLAWPHVGGIRYWVSKGATVISHKASEKFIRSIIKRKWIFQPDELEMHRKPLKFKGVDDLTYLNKNILIAPIDGIGSEGALMCYLTKENFLWASDYIQNVEDISRSSSYTYEIIKAVKRIAVDPLLVGAEHIPLTPWTKIISNNKVKEEN
ncbi:MAG: hypothetical protein ACJ748_04240 [Flavisolibacter sp.]